MRVLNPTTNIVRVEQNVKFTKSLNFKEKKKLSNETQYKSSSNSSLAKLPKISTLPILLLATCFNVKSNLDKYNDHLICLQFNFWAFMKYSKFLWSIQISNRFLTLSKKCITNKILTDCDTWMIVILELNSVSEVQYKGMIIDRW